MKLIPRIPSPFVTTATVSVLLFSLCSVGVEGFLQLMRKNPIVKTISESQIGTLLDIRLDVGTKSRDGSKMSINGMLLKLSEELSKSKKEEKHASPLPLPTNDGKNGRIMRSLQVVKEGQFIDMTGLKKVQVENGSWEIVREEGPTGSLICGFDIPEGVTRNAASLPKGKVFLSFPMWTADVLSDLQQRKADVARLAKEAIDDKTEALRKFQQTVNPLKKMWYYREAAAAAERYQMTGVNTYNHIPAGEQDVVKIGDGVFMANQGKLWSQTGFVGKPVVHGTAHVKFQSEEQEEKTE